MNDELKRQVGNESKYQEPLKQENERIMQENNMLHLEVIRLKEQSQSSGGDMYQNLK